MGMCGWGSPRTSRMRTRDSGSFHRFAKFRALPIVLSESDPEGCAACSARVYPENAYRNGPMYPAYTAAAMKGILDLAERDGAHIAGMLTWAFEFEDQPYFDGLRTLATNGVDKPILNLFRMDGMMRGERVKVESAGAVGLASMVKDGVRGDADVDAIAVRGDREISILVWNYHDDDAAAPEAKVAIHVAGLPGSGPRVLLRHYRIDDTHSNAYSAWKRMGSPQDPSGEQRAELERAGQLQLLESPRWIEVRAGTAEAGLHSAAPRRFAGATGVVTATRPSSSLPQSPTWRHSAGRRFRRGAGSCFAYNF